MHKTERKFHQFLSVFLSFCMIFALTVGNYGDYVRADPDDENEGKSTASYDCVWFGQYPQSEVPQGSELYQTLSGLTESSWNSCRETLYQGKRYRRMKAYQAHQYWLEDSGYFQWKTIKKWRYFVYEPIKWRVLSREDGKALLLADQAVDSGQYGGSSWSSCRLRKWLNTEININNLSSTEYYFQCYAFSEQERSAIVSREVPADDAGTQKVTDSVTLPDMSELTDTGYGFKATAQEMDDARSCTMTEFAFAMGAQSNNGCMSGAYWLRYHPGEWENCVGYTGMYMRDHMIADTCFDICIRPMLLLDLSKTSCYEDAGTVDFNLPEGERVQAKAYSNPLRGCFPYLYGAGKNAWDCVWWGHYPGQEVTGEDSWKLYREILAQPETEWKDDILTLQNCRYLRAGSASERRYFAIQPVRWRVLQRDEQGLMLMADECIDIRKYRDSGETVLWKDSALRKWLNASDGLSGTMCSVPEQNMLQTISGEKITLPDQKNDNAVKVKANGVFSDYAKAVWQWEKGASDTLEEDMQKNGWWLSDSTGQKTSGWYACIRTAGTKPQIFEEIRPDNSTEVNTSVRGVVPVISIPLSAEKELVRAGTTLEEGNRDVIGTEGSQIPISHRENETPAPTMAVTEAAVTSSPEISEEPVRTLDPITTPNREEQTEIPELLQSPYPTSGQTGEESPSPTRIPQSTETPVPVSSKAPQNSENPDSSPQSSWMPRPVQESQKPAENTMPPQGTEVSLPQQSAPGGSGDTGNTFSGSYVEGVSLTTGNNGQVVIRWKAYDGAQGYEIFRKKRNGKNLRIAIVSSKKQSYQDYGATIEGIYYYTVRAYYRDKNKWWYSEYGTWEPVQITVTVDRPVLRITKQKHKLLFRIRHGQNACGLSMEMRKGKRRYHQVRLGKQSSWIKTEGDKTTFSMRVGAAKGIYSFRIRTYRIIRKKKYFSRYSGNIKIRL